MLGIQPNVSSWMLFVTVVVNSSDVKKSVALNAMTTNDLRKQIKRNIKRLCPIPVKSLNARANSAAWAWCDRPDAALTQLG